MRADKRREELIGILKKEDAPVSAAKLAAHFSVSRQIIVGDIALLRAAGENITATPRGYILGESRTGTTHTIACIHEDGRMRDELCIMVDNGCYVENVIVEHPVYGQLIGRLDIASRHDVDEFIRKVKGSSAAPLSELTGGLHLHTLRCPDEASYERVLEELRKKGYLYSGAK